MDKSISLTVEEVQYVQRVLNQVYTNFHDLEHYRAPCILLRVINKLDAALKQ